MPWGPTSAELIQEREDMVAENTSKCGDALSDHDFTLTSHDGLHTLYGGNDTPVVVEYVHVHGYSAECNWCAIRYSKRDGFHE
jgi:hypothetical protein